MNILTDPLPETVEINGSAWPIYTGFDVGVQFELIMQDSTLTPAERMSRALSLYYPMLPPDLNGAINGLLWFYSCGHWQPKPQEAAEGGRPSVQPQKPRRQKVYCFEQDAELIYAAFMAAYSIDLNDVPDLHWWKFRALFTALPSDCEFRQVMGYRSADTKGMSKKQKEFYNKMKRQYALRNPMDVSAAVSLAERDQRMKDYVARRFAEVGGASG